MLERTAKLIFSGPRIVEASVALTSVVASENLEKFKNLVAGIKKVAPKSDEFIYFVCRAIHSMEAANLDPKTGELVGDGVVEAETGIWRSASSRLPYINQNGDAFPEAELLKVVGRKDGRDIQAYHTFIGRGLFVNHASDDAEKIRGIILDATWDEKTKGVDLLVACDRVAYPELARQIQAGYSNDVSMGTQVQWSVCSHCYNKARVEADYCQHVKTAKGGFFGGKPVYEVNYGLNFIEISVVATGADPKAKIRQVIASLTKLADSRSATLKSDASKPDLTAAQADFDKIRSTLHVLASVESYDDVKMSSLGIDLSDNTQNASISTNQDIQSSLIGLTEKLADLQKQIFEIKGKTMSTQNKEVKAYLNDEGQGELNKTEQDKPEFKQNYTTVRDKQDKQMVGKGMESGKDGMHPGYGESDEAVKSRLQRASMKAKLIKAADKAQSKWVVTAGDAEVLSATASDFYGDALSAPSAENPTQSNTEWVHSKEFGLNLMAAIRQLGLSEVKAQITNAISSRTAACAMKDKMEKVVDEKDVKKDEKKDDKKDDKKDEVKDEAKDEKKDEKKVAASMPKKAQMAPGADMNLGAPVEQPPAEAAAKKPEEEGDGDVDVNINVSPEGKDEEAGAGLPADAKQALQDVAGQIADLGDQLSAIISGDPEDEGALDETAAKEADEVGNEVVDSGDELAELDKALGQASATEDASQAKGDEAGVAKAASTKFKLAKLVMAAVSDAKQVVAKGKAFVKKHKKDEKKDDKKSDKLETRKAARKALAEKLYDLTNDGMMEKDAHPKGNTTAVPGHEFKTQSGAHDVGEKVAEKNPTGKLTAAQQARRAKVVAFVQSAQVAPAKEEIAPGVPANTAPKAPVAPGAVPPVGAAKPEDATKPELAKTAAVDKEAKSYYNELFNSDPEAKAFAKDLTKDYDGKVSKASIEEAKGKMHRAYRTALRQAKLGQIASTNEAVENQVNTLLELDDKAFEAFNKAVANTAKSPIQAESKTGMLKVASVNNIEQGSDVVVDARTAQMKDRANRVTELATQLNDLGWSTTGKR